MTTIEEQTIEATVKENLPFVVGELFFVRHLKNKSE